MLDLVELFTHWHAGRSQVQLSASLGIDRKTVRKYLAPAIADGIERVYLANGVSGGFH